MKYQDIISNPLIKIIAMFAILYFALFHNKYGANTMKERYSKDNIKKSVSDIVDKKRQIQKKLNDAKYKGEKPKGEKYKDEKHNINKTKQENEKK